MNNEIIKLAKYFLKNNIHSEVENILKLSSLSQKQIDSLLKLLTSDDDVSRRQGQMILDTYSDDYETIHDLEKTFRDSKYFLESANIMVRNAIINFDGTENSLLNIDKDVPFLKSINESLEDMYDKPEFFYYSFFSNIDLLKNFIIKYILKVFVNQNYDVSIEEQIDDNILDSVKESINSISYNLTVIEEHKEYRAPCCEDGSEVESGLDDCDNSKPCDDWSDAVVTVEENESHNHDYDISYSEYSDFQELVDDLKDPDYDIENETYLNNGDYISMTSEFGSDPQYRMATGCEVYHDTNSGRERCGANRPSFVEVGEHFTITKTYTDMYNNSLSINFNKYEEDKIKEKYEVI